MASSVGAPYEITVPDDVEVILYSACDNSDSAVETWVWEGKEWKQVEDVGKVLDVLIGKYAPKPPKPPKPAPKPTTVDPKVYQTAEEYAIEFDKRQKIVAKAAKKVLK